MPIDLSVIGKPLEPSTFEYEEKDVILYALGVGAGASGGVDDLRFTYEGDLRTLPSFAVVPAFPALFAIGGAMDVNPMMILHGEQRIELGGEIPTSGRLVTTPTIRAIYDKGSGAVVVIDAETVDAKGKSLFKNVFTAFVRGEGGFGGERGPSGVRNALPDRAPDLVIEMPTSPAQALLYRLSGDRNPLHADPGFAAMGGFDRPILHGLCTFGHVGRAILGAFATNEPARITSFEARFAGVVYPGETIVAELWDAGDGRIVAQARTRERGELVLSQASATITIA